MKYNPRCNMRCAKRGVVMGLKELVSIYVLPSCCIGRPKERFRQITMEEAFQEAWRVIKTPRAPTGMPEGSGVEVSAG